MKKIAVVISTLALTGGIFAQGVGPGGAGGASGSSGAAGVSGISGAGAIGQPSGAGNARIGTAAPDLGNPAPGVANPNPNLGNATPGGLGTAAPGIGNPVPNLPNPAAQPSVNPNLTPSGVANPANSVLGTTNPPVGQLKPLITPDAGLNRTNGLVGTATNRPGVGSSAPGSRGFGQGGTTNGPNGLVPLNPGAVNSDSVGATGVNGTSSVGPAK